MLVQRARDSNPRGRNGYRPTAFKKVPSESGRAATQPAAPPAPASALCRRLARRATRTVHGVMTTEDPFLGGGRKAARRLATGASGLCAAASSPQLVVHGGTSCDV